MSGDGENRIVRGIKPVEEAFNLFQRSVSYMTDLLADGRPAVRMVLVSHFAQQVCCVAVRLVQVALLEFFDDYLTLYFQALRTEVEA